MEGQSSVTHVPYSKMSETTANWSLDAQTQQRFKKVKWCVTEKVHGANCCWITDGKTVWAAKRKSLLEAGELFYPGHSKVQEETIAKALKLFGIISETQQDPKLPRIELVSIFGEFFGGGYPHDDVTACPGLEPVQTGVYYSPDVHFCAFDILVQRTGHPPVFVDYEIAMNVFKETDFFFAKPLYVGKYEDCLNFNIRFNSKIHENFGLPPLASNQAEGVVIKPLKELVVSTKKGATRAIVKKKAPEFAEVKYHEAEKPKVGFNENGNLVEALQWEIAAYITDNRVINALSKIGAVDHRDVEKLKELYNMFLDDIIESFQEDQEEEWQKLSKAEQNELKELTGKEAKLFLKEFFRKKVALERKNKAK
eukprot:TRINITY_DN3823_c0_g1_i1.p1 TRINITY_DN3823_c0_g1~~TRINITY_DN3823_c0_g1_i1.p1  ORF type:complete len:367 (-),score=85.33 TRINITY_DN3823_c0_g1_i1:17-1117(-)